ncbi:hypothetical protein Tcan_04463 [Toxocara canis]|uniref:FYVE-type domain-containing protein n=1 Tax=Toxocara canis TaxID=6265 RepID=A0A0B2VD62_TOXCA|nr:hypothetical protein Tcan_04463 [Toxocara canis]
MDQLTDEHLTHFVSVLALDMQFKRNILINICAEESMLRRLSISSNDPSHCAFCSQSIEPIEKQVECSKCHRHLCISCASDTICNFCTREQELKQKRKQFAMICPFAQNQFGYAKLNCENLKAIDKAEWMLRAKLEMHFTYQLKVDLDSSNIFISIKDMNLENSRRGLVTAMRRFNEAEPFLQVDEALLEVQKCCANNESLLATARNTSKCKYLSLLSFAIISSMVSSSTSNLSASVAGNSVNPPLSASSVLTNSTELKLKSKPVSDPALHETTENERREATEAVQSDTMVTQADDCRKELARARKQLQQSIETNLLLTRTNQQLLDIVDDLLRRTFARKGHLNTIYSRPMPNKKVEK